MKHLHSYTSKDQSRKSSMFYNGSDEYVVRFYLDGQHQIEADYFTDDYADADGTAQHFVDNEPAPVLKSLTNAEFCALVGPLVERNIAFELALPGHLMAWLTWRGGDDVDVVWADGSKGRIGLAASGYKAVPAGLAALETIHAMEAA